jgi:hypothetical protein
MEDDSHVFYEEKGIVAQLLDSLNDHFESADIKVLLRQIIDSLVNADYILTETAITSNPRGKEILAAVAEMNKAGEDLAKGHPDHAIGHYKAAWQHAVVP